MMDHKPYDAFEEAVRESLENFEVPFEPADWENMEQSLNALDQSAKVSKLWKSALVAAGVIALLGTSWFLFLDESEESSAPAIAEVEQPVQEPVVEPAEAQPEIEPATESAVEIVVLDDEEKEKAIQPEPVKTEMTAEEKLNAPAPKAFIKPLSNPAVCLNAEMHFSAEVDKSVDATYIWDFGDGTNMVGSAVSHTYSKPGDYSVVLTAKSRWNNKQETHTQHVTVNESKTPQALFSAREGNPVMHDNSIQFTMETVGADNWIWSVNGEPQTETANPKFMFWEKGNYKVKLSVYDDHGCESTEVQSVTVKRDHDMYAPQAFSPNGDGMADTWMPLALKYTDMPFNLTIMNSDFKIVHRITDKGGEAWTGQGTQPGEKYYWQVTMTDYQDKEMNFMGTITIVD